MKNEQILWNNWFTEWFQPRLLTGTNWKNTLLWRPRVRVLEFIGTQLIEWELNEDEYISLRTLNKLTDSFCWGDWEVGEVAITEDAFILFIKPLGAKCDCCYE